MKASKKRKLEAAGWKSGTAAEFLGLTPAEEVQVEIRLALASSLKTMRRGKKISQAVLAERIGSSQSRVAKMESADGSVSLDLLIGTLASLGASQRQIGKAIASRVTQTA